MKKAALIFTSLIIIGTVGYLIISGHNRLQRPVGPGDIFEQAGTPCASAHSTTRALFKDYNGPLYQIMRQSDGKTLDIGVVMPSRWDPGGYADARSQDKFLKDTYGWITIVYDQGPMGNHLNQAPRGRFGGPAMGGFNNLPLADMAPVTIMGHKVYGVYIIPGMGLRCNDTRGIAVDDQAEGQYWVIAGNHYNDGCCFDYGNAEIDSNNDGDGTMEATYFGSAAGWHWGVGQGPWIMTDQENHLVGCDVDRPKEGCPNLLPVTWRFVTATADGESHHWRMLGGNAQEGPLETLWDGDRIHNDRESYDPMRKQGAIVLGNGGDNSTTAQGTFYEGAVTFAGNFPAVETLHEVQKNIVSAEYRAPGLTIAPLDQINTPPGVQTFSLGQDGEVAVKYVNRTSDTVSDLVVRLKAPRGWVIKNNRQRIRTDIAPGQSVMLLFQVTSCKKESFGDMVAYATCDKGRDRALQKVRAVPPVKINEFCIDGGRAENDSYIEIYNAGESDVDISGWSVTMRPIHLPVSSSIIVPPRTVLKANSHYLMGLAPSGLAAPASKGDGMVYLRSTKGISVGDEITIGDGATAERHRVAGIGPKSNTPMPSAVWQPLPDGPVIEVPKGANNIPVFNTNGISEGSVLAIGYGTRYPVSGVDLERYEIVTVSHVGTPGTQAYLAYDAEPGDTNIKVTSVRNISVGDEIRLDIDSQGHGIETVKVKAVGTPSTQRSFYGPMSLEEAGTGLDLEQPLKFAHSANLPFSVRGTGISVTAPLKQAHFSNEPVINLCCYVQLEEPLNRDHGIDEAVMTAGHVTGYQGEADQFYGGPAFPVPGGMMASDGRPIHRGGKGSSTAGSIILKSAAGIVCDALNYGLVSDPWLAEGFQGTSGASERGNYVRLYPEDVDMGRTLRYPGVSYSRFPDGADTDDNINDFRISSPTPGGPNAE